MDITKIQLQKHVLKDDSDYPNWVPNVKALIETNDKFGGSEAFGDNPDDDVKLKLYNFLLLYTDGRAQRIVMQNTNDGVAAWKELREEFAPDDVYHLQSIRSRFFETKPRPGESMSSYIDRVEDIQYQSAITGSDNKITDEEVMALVSRNLPEKLHGLLSFAQTTGMEWKKLRRQLRDYERRFASSEGKDAFSPALVASQTAPKTGTKKDRWCDFCEMSSHHTKYCRNMKRARELFREQRRRQPGQGDGHAAFFGPNLSASSSQAAASSATSLSPATSFIVDTGASQHICGDINMFVGPMKFCDVNI